MTTRQLNADIKKLAKKNIIYSGGNFNQEAHNEISNEIKRLYYADDKFEYMSKNSALILFKLNLRYRIIALHQFGGQIDITKLI